MILYLIIEMYRTTNIFHYLLSDTVILKISEHKTEQLVCNGYDGGEEVGFV